MKRKLSPVAQEVADAYWADPRQLPHHLLGLAAVLRSAARQRLLPSDLLSIADELEGSHE